MEIAPEEVCRIIGMLFLENQMKDRTIAGLMARVQELEAKQGTKTK